MEPAKGLPSLGSEDYDWDKKQSGIPLVPSIHPSPPRQMLDLSDEVLILILKLLDPFSLLNVGSSCSTLYRVCLSNSLWTRHCRIFFRLSLHDSSDNIPPKDAFKLLYIWHKVYNTLPYNRQLQDLLFKAIPPPNYWTQWLVLEEIVPLPPVKLPDYKIEELWGINKSCLVESHRVSDEQDTEQFYKYTWKELYNLTVLQHGHLGNVTKHVLRKQTVNSHDELEWMYRQYCRFRFQWMFAYWLFGVSKPCGRNLRRIYLQWQTYNKKKMLCWGTAGCDVQYFASLHHVTEDYWKGRLAKGDETLGIQTVENYFSMCKSLLAWILGRKWGKLKQKKVYLDTLEGVYRELRSEMHGSPIVHENFWQVAKVQMTRVCELEKTAMNYVNWRIIETVPYYRLYMSSGNPSYLEQIKRFLCRKRMINNWILQDEYYWVRHLLSDGLIQLLEFDAKISEDMLHGDSLRAHLSRTIWLYLHSGEQHYMEAVKELVLECAQARLDFYMSMVLSGS